MSARPTVLVGTTEGLMRLGEHRPVELAGGRVTALAPAPDRRGWLALLGDRFLWAGEADGPWDQVASFDEGPPARCLVAAGDDVLVGTAEAHLLRVRDGRAEPVPGFEKTEGRDGWYTPWGGPPDTRSLSVGADGTIYANVHVGGIVRSSDAGETWEPTIDIDTDVHQVLAVNGSVLAPSAYGLATSADGGDSWDMVTDGLHATYLRAVAVAGDDVLVSASTGPGGERSAVYRRAGGQGPFERCQAGLPEWLSGNIDTGTLAAAGGRVVFAAPGGTLYASSDAGRTWETLAEGLPRVTAVALG
ncbi:MAG TPA: hypothetical protein VHG90_12320 [Acidimicrobiales bacterium]|nr:hypothetical protein [Acidimicrobiales bacterium]